MPKIIRWLFIVLLLVIIGWALWWWFIQRPAHNDNLVPLNDGQSALTPQVGMEDVGNLPVAVDDRVLIQKALNWGERFATYSNHDNYQNFAELYSVMTENMRAQNQSFIDQLRAAHKPTDPYWGITSRALTAAIQSGGASSGSTTIKVSLQRHETGQNLDQTYPQDLLFEIVKIDTDWFIQTVRFLTP